MHHALCTAGFGSPAAFRGPHGYQQQQQLYNYKGNPVNSPLHGPYNFPRPPYNFHSPGMHAGGFHGPTELFDSQGNPVTRPLGPQTFHQGPSSY